MPTRSQNTPSTAKTDEAARREFLEALDKLIAYVQESEPGFEFDHTGPLLTTLNKTAQQLGYPFFGSITGTGMMGKTEHRRVLMLLHPVDEDTFHVPVYTFDGPLTPSWEGTADEYAAEFFEVAREVERIEYKKVKYNEVNRHITTPEERGRILSCLKAWRLAVGGSAIGDPPIGELVTLRQVAPLTGLSKRTLERALADKKLPKPDFPGGDGKSHKWLWTTLRTALEKLSARPLPERFPGQQII